jgi:hypothetical protein
MHTIRITAARLFFMPINFEWDMAYNNLPCTTVQEVITYSVGVEDVTSEVKEKRGLQPPRPRTLLKNSEGQSKDLILTGTLLFALHSHYYHCLHVSARQVVIGHVPFKGKAEKSYPS